MTEHKHRRRRGLSAFVHSHSLTLAALGILAVWTFLYARSDLATHLGAFFGNSIADWTGTLFLVVGTKFLYESGSAESRPVRRHLPDPRLDFLLRHSLTIFLLLTGIGLAVLYGKQDPESKWGQVVGNTVSEWVQMIGIVFLTKRLLERGSKESKR